MSAGIYLMTYRGAAGWGQGLLNLIAGRVTGADAAGGLYDGTYREDDANLYFDIKMTVPPGVTLVQGIPAQATTQIIPFATTIPKRAIEAGEPVLARLPPGAVNVIMKLLRPLEA